jgi:hypothetical protein
MKQSGSALGYGQYAAAITQTASGRYQVSDPTMRSEILKLRNDPTANAIMAGAFTQSNAAVLSARLGRSPSEGELYIAHFLGAGGGARLISSAAAHPDASAASYFPIAAQANASIFYDRSTGQPRSLAQVRDMLTARYDMAARTSPSPNAVAQAAITPVAGVSANAAASAALTTHFLRTIRIFPAPAAAAANASDPAAVAAAVPDTAGMTSAFAAAIPPAPKQDGDMFHGLFADPGRTGPVAAVVSQLWGVSATPGANSASAPSSGTLFDLFKDNGRGSS